MPKYLNFIPFLSALMTLCISCETLNSPKYNYDDVKVEDITIPTDRDDLAWIPWTERYKGHLKLENNCVYFVDKNKESHLVIWLDAEVRRVDNKISILSTNDIKSSKGMKAYLGQDAEINGVKETNPNKEHFNFEGVECNAEKVILAIYWWPKGDPWPYGLETYDY